MTVTPEKSINSKPKAKKSTIKLPMIHTKPTYTQQPSPDRSKSPLEKQTSASPALKSPHSRDRSPSLKGKKKIFDKEFK